MPPCCAKSHQQRQCGNHTTTNHPDRQRPAKAILRTNPSCSISGKTKCDLWVYRMFAYRSCVEDCWTERLSARWIRTAIPSGWDCLACLHESQTAREASGERRERSVLCLHAPSSILRQGIPPRQGIQRFQRLRYCGDELELEETTNQVGATIWRRPPSRCTSQRGPP